MGNFANKTVLTLSQQTTTKDNKNDISNVQVQLKVVKVKVRTVVVFKITKAS